jgi:hypothetical protein
VCHEITATMMREKKIGFTCHILCLCCELLTFFCQLHSIANLSSTQITLLGLMLCLFLSHPTAITSFKRELHAINTVFLPCLQIAINKQQRLNNMILRYGNWIEIQRQVFANKSSSWIDCRNTPSTSAQFILNKRSTNYQQFLLTWVRLQAQQSLVRISS